MDCREGPYIGCLHAPVPHWVLIHVYHLPLPPSPLCPPMPPTSPCHLPSACAVCLHAHAARLHAHAACLCTHAVMDHYPTLHVLPKPSLHLQQLSPFPNLLDQPPSHLGHQPTSHSLSYDSHMFLLSFLLDTLNSPCLNFGLQPLTLTLVSHSQLSDSIPDSCIVADTVGTPQLDL